MFGRGPYPLPQYPGCFTRPSRCHYPAHPPFFSVIAAAPRPLRLRRGFVVTTAPLNGFVAIRFAKCLCSVAQQQSDFIISLRVK